MKELPEDADAVCDTDFGVLDREAVEFENVPRVLMLLWEMAELPEDADTVGETELWSANEDDVELPGRLEEALLGNSEELIGEEDIVRELAVT